MTSRPYCAICQFAGKDRFVLGTVMSGPNSPLHEIESLFHEVMDRLFAIRPDLVNILPGQLVFREEMG